MLSTLCCKGVKIINNYKPPKSGDIYHIVIAQNGVWVIETKNEDGEFSLRNGVLMKNGKYDETDKVDKVLRGKRRIESELIALGYEVPVFGVLVYAGERASLKESLSISKVIISDSLRLVQVIDTTRSRIVLSPIEIDRIYKDLSKD